MVKPLIDCLEEIGAVAVAVSGGVDSMTLAVVAHRTLGERAQMIHAVSPAVPPDASARVRRYAERAGWRLSVIDAGEFADARYRANPANRCFFCKTNLYAAMAQLTDAVLVSGTNLDDLGDYRPGLRAAAEYGVRHPYVEAGIDKQGVRALARSLGLDDLAQLPAAPCLSSRIETGIAIDAATLTMVDAVEKRLRDELKPKTVRCRVRREVIAIELDEAALSALGPAERQAWAARVAQSFQAIGNERRVEFQPYRMGSAFLHPRPHG
jgi:uncharacterized protein